MIRKTALLIVFIAGIAFAFPAMAQKCWRVGYVQYVMNPAPLRSGYRVHSDMRLDYFGKIAAYYCERSFLQDSLSVIAFDKNGNIKDTEAYDLLSRTKGGIKLFAHIDLNASIFTIAYQEATCCFFGTDRLEMPTWKTEDDTKEVNGRICKKATALFLGRSWTAWYCEDIPIPFGPWLLWGLPGLIMEAQDDTEEIRFAYHYMEPLEDNSRAGFLFDYYKKNKLFRHRVVGDIKTVERTHTKFMCDEQFQNKMTGTLSSRMVDRNGKTVRESDYFRYLPIIPESYWNDK